MSAPKNGPAHSAVRAAAITTAAVTRIFSRKETQNGSSVMRGDGSNLELAAQFDHAVGGDPEELGGVQHIVGHEREQPAAGTGEPRVLCRDNLLASQEERGLHEIEAELHQPELRERAGYVGRIGETIMHD